MEVLLYRWVLQLFRLQKSSKPRNLTIVTSKMSVSGSCTAFLPPFGQPRPSPNVDVEAHSGLDRPSLRTLQRPVSVAASATSSSPLLDHYPPSPGKPFPFYILTHFNDNRCFRFRYLSWQFRSRNPCHKIWPTSSIRSISLSRTCPFPPHSDSCFYSLWHFKGLRAPGIDWGNWQKNLQCSRYWTEHGTWYQSCKQLQSYSFGLPMVHSESEREAYWRGKCSLVPPRSIANKLRSMPSWIVAV